MKNVINKSFISHSEQETFLFAEELDKFPLGTIFLLKGDLGSGKTTFENYCFALNPVYVRIYSSIDGVKRIAE